MTQHDPNQYAQQPGAQNMNQPPPIPGHPAQAQAQAPQYAPPPAQAQYASPPQYAQPQTQGYPGPAVQPTPQAQQQASFDILAAGGGGSNLDSFPVGRHIVDVLQIAHPENFEHPATIVEASVVQSDNSTVAPGSVFKDFQQTGFCIPKNAGPSASLKPGGVQKLQLNKVSSLVLACHGFANSEQARAAGKYDECVAQVMALLREQAVPSLHGSRIAVSVRLGKKGYPEVRYSPAA